MYFHVWVGGEYWFNCRSSFLSLHLEEGGAMFYRNFWKGPFIKKVHGYKHYAFKDKLFSMKKLIKRYLHHWANKSQYLHTENKKSQGQPAVLFWEFCNWCHSNSGWLHSFVLHGNSWLNSLVDYFIAARKKRLCPPAEPIRTQRSAWSEFPSCMCSLSLMISYHT